MELRHLRYFVAVAEEQNITRAATRLHVSQPPLSRQIRDLEDELGVTLFLRSAKAVQLTDAGRLFLQDARAVLEHAEDAVQRVKASARSESGEVHLGYAPSPTAEILPRALHAFSNMAPDIRVTLHDCSSEELLTGLRKGHLDLALLVQPCPNSLKGIRFHEITRYPFRIAMRANHPWSRTSSIPVSRIVHEPLVVYSKSQYGDYHALLDVLYKPHRARPKIALECDSVTSLIAAVESGRGLAFLPEVVRFLAGNRIKLKTIDPEPEPVIVGWAMKAGTVSRHTQKLAQTLQQLCSTPSPASQP